MFTSYVTPIVIKLILKLETTKWIQKFSQYKRKIFFVKVKAPSKYWNFEKGCDG